MPTTASTWDGVTGDWDTAADWSPSGVPNSSTAQATINSGTVTIASGASDAVETLSIEGSGALLTVLGTLSVYGSMDIENGTFALSQNGTILGAPDVTIGSSGTLDISAATLGTNQAVVFDSLSDDGQILLGNNPLAIGVLGGDSQLSGTISASAGGSVLQLGVGSVTLDGVTMGNGAFYVADGSLVENAGSSSLFYLAIGEGTSSTASGTLSSGTLTIGNTDPNSGAALQIGDWGGTGSFTQTGGLLSLVGSLNIGNQGGSGSYDISGGTLALDGGAYVLGHNTVSTASSGLLSISGTGVVEVASGPLIIGDNVSSTGAEGSGTIVQTGGTLEIDPTGALYLAAYGNGRYDLDGGVLQVGGANLHGVYNAHGGSYAFNIGGGTIDVVGSALTTSVNATLTDGTTSTIDLEGLGANFTGSITGSGNLDITGSGSASFTSLVTTGGLTLNGDTLDLSAGTSDQIGALNGTGTIILGNAALAIGSGNADSTFSGLIETGTTKQGGLIDKIGTGSLTIDNVVMNVGTNNSGLYIADGSLIENAGSSSLYYLAVGEGSGSTASATLSGGSLTIGGSSGAALQIGDWGGTGTFNQTGGTLTVATGSLNIGNQGGNGSYIISAGTLSFEGGIFDIGRYKGITGGSSGTLSISGGLVDVETGQIVLGSQYTPDGTGSSGTIIQTGGELRIEAGVSLYLTGQADAHGLYDLDGGTLSIGGASLNAGGGTYAFNLGGGTIDVIGSAFDAYFNATLTDGTTSTIDLEGLGANFSGSITGSGNLDITGTGTASFSHLLTTGAVTLGGDTLDLSHGSADSIGTLSGTGTVALGNAALTVGSGSGNLDITGSGAASFTSLVTTGTVTLDGSTLDLSAGTSDQIGALNGTGTIILGNTALAIGAGDADSTFSGLIETGTTKQGGLIDKIGTGSLTIDNVVMNAGTNNSGLYIADGSLIENAGSSSLYYLAVGEGTGSTASATLSGGSLTIGGNSGAALQIGDWGGTGTFNQTGGTLTVATGSLNIGNQGGNGSYIISAGTLSFEGGIFDIGRSKGTISGSTGTLSISGTGLVDVASGQLVLGSQYSPTGANSSGTIIQTGGELRIENGITLYLSGQSGSEGLYDLDGGTLSIGGASLNGGIGTYAFNLGGGTIDVIGSALTTSVNATLTDGTTSAIDLEGLGANFSGSITGSGNLDITGTGTASFSHLLTTGIVDLAGNGMLSLSDNGAVGELTVGANHSATVSVHAGDTLSLSGATGLSIGNAGTLELTGGSITSTGSIVNAGSLTLDNTALTDTGTLTNNGAITLDPSSLTVAALAGTGTVTIESGSTLDVEGAVSAGETIVFSGSNDLLQLGASSDIILGTIVNFGTDDTIDFTGLSYDSHATATLSGDILTVVDGATTLHLNLTSTTGYAGLHFHLAQDGSGTSLNVNDDPTCYCAGTRILTDRGDVAIESLRIGDRVATAENGLQMIRWIGQSTVATRFADPMRVAPVRIRAGAFGAGVPARDLRVSPCHAVFLEGVLVQANALVNGTSIVQEIALPERFTYYHIELATHALLMAEGLAAESFVDYVSRMTFDNWDEYLALGLDEPIHEMQYPRVQSHRQVPYGLRKTLDALQQDWMALNSLSLLKVG